MTCSVSAHWFWRTGEVAPAVKVKADRLLKDVRRFRDALRRLGKSEDAAGRGQERGGKSAAAHWQAARMLAHRRVSPMARLFGAVEEMVDQK